jgi:hypothetical protein
MTTAPSRPNTGDAGGNECSQPGERSEQPRLNPGQLVTCRVMEQEPGGYAVYLDIDNLPGFLPTDMLLQAGFELHAQFVCFHQGRALVSMRNLDKDLDSYPKVRTPAVQWTESSATDSESGEHSLEAIDSSEQTGPIITQRSENEALAVIWAPAACGQTETAKSLRSTFKRATDLVVPPFDDRPQSRCCGKMDRRVGRTQANRVHQISLRIVYFQIGAFDFSRFDNRRSLY